MATESRHTLTRTDTTTTGPSTSTSRSTRFYVGIFVGAHLPDHRAR